MADAMIDLGTGAEKTGAGAGFDAGRLAAAPAAVQPFIDRGALSGAVTLTWRRGETAQVNALGARNLETGAPMTRDTLFRIASMTKPVTTAAALMLLERGDLALSDPITRWAPEFADMRVLRDPAGSLEESDPAPRAITVEDLMTHRSGLAYDFSSRGPLAKAYADALGSPLANPHGPDEWLARLATLPLSYPPGERMHYSVSTDVLGFIVARIMGTTLGQALRTLIFDPLGMDDTAFYIPPAKRDRYAVVYRFDETAGRLTPVPFADHDRSPAFEGGGGGLVSTADDYLKFARLLLAGGEVDGVRLLRPETVADMRTNRLTDRQREVDFLGMPFWAGMGFGLGLSIVDRPEKNMGVGSVGSFGWPGAFGTWWQADPVEDMILIYLIAHSIPLTPDAGAMIAAGRGIAGRLALPAFQRATYDAVAGRAGGA